ncbi:MAG: hypothetical protein AUH29_03155 [Candidatus Rokubacteria bacterium 13_1_40CM_69_27]|nr:MAG: hypothetical protein AUH29_03155 [Candidatus Rokubacteria bacterium 13_1_40CM_69_27]OLC31329.1 MAG: hypothetical protein AUH81_18130 [Candidatus Rokubacteria bacterium 13_1_40CM_4_69_5]OLE39454.1 MAG: hypothetical protein AUG00_02065 [Candidatus Rokubacteria bacterium 13_1_20CM_2_70_7]
MEPTVAADIRERVAQWVQEGLRLLPHLPGLLHSAEAARAAELERECEKLRRELEDLRKEQERLRGDRDEVTQAFSRLMESVQPINQLVQKLGVRRSPFERDPRGSATPPAPGTTAPSGGTPPGPAPTPGPTPKPS